MRTANVSARAKSGVPLRIAKVTTLDISRILTRLRAAKDEETRDVLGRIFEKWVLLKLSEKATTVQLCRQLLTTSAKTLGGLEQWVIPNRTRASFLGQDASEVTPSASTTLWVPQNVSFPVVDAIIVTGNKATLIQVTVGVSHKPKAPAWEQLLASLAKNQLVVDSLVFIVDSNSALRCRQELDDNTSVNDANVLNEYDKLPQYMCRMDERMCWVTKENSGVSVCFPVALDVDFSNTKVVEELINTEMKASTATLVGHHCAKSGSFEVPIVYRV